MKYVFPEVWILGFGLATILTPAPQNKIVFSLVEFWERHLFCGLMRFEAGAHGRTTALCVQLLSEIYLPFSAITDVKQNRWINSRPITIYFRDATQFGDEVTFMPKQRFQFWSVDPIVNELKRLARLVAPESDIR